MKITESDLALFLTQDGVLEAMNDWLAAEREVATATLTMQYHDKKLVDRLKSVVLMDGKYSGSNHENPGEQPPEDAT